MNASTALETKSATELSSVVNELEIQLERRTAELLDLARMGALLASLLRLEEVLAALMEMVLRTLNAQVGAICIKTDEGLSPQIFWGLDQRLLPHLRWEGQPLVERVVEQNEGVLLNDYDDGGGIQIEGMSLHVEAVMAHPIATSQGPVGCVVVVNRQTGGGFTEDDRIGLETLLHFASVAMENARLLEESLERQRMEHDLALGGEVQRALIPSMDSDLGSASARALYIPARGVGGDYFDLLPLGDNQVLLVLGDVSSKGVPAALIMAGLRSIVRSSVQHIDNIAGWVTEINRIICDDLVGEQEKFVTFFCAKFDFSRGEVTYTNAGHLPPYLWHRESGEVVELPKGGVFLGQFPDFQFTETVEPFGAGDRLLVYTDGIVEAADEAGQLYGRERLETFMRDNNGLPPDEFLKKLRDDVEENFGNADYIDDVTAVLVDIKTGGNGA